MLASLSELYTFAMANGGDDPTKIILVNGGGDEWHVFGESAIVVASRTGSKLSHWIVDYETIPFTTIERDEESVWRYQLSCSGRWVTCLYLPEKDHLS